MSLHTRFEALLCAAVLLTQAGCKKALPDPASPAPAVEGVDSPPTEPEAKQFAERMSQAARARNAAAIDKLVSLQDLCERLISDLGLSARDRQAFLKGMTRPLQQAGVGQQILQSTKGDGSYKLLRIRTVGGRPRPLFRLIHSDGGLNYHEYILTRHKDGEVASEDMFVYVSGEPLSQSIRRLVIPVLQSKDWLGRIDPQESRSLQTLGTMSKALRSGDFKSALAAYRTLPKESQERKPVLLAYLHATMNLGADGEADYVAALETFRRLYPDDAASDFISIDYFFLKMRYDEARRAIDRLNKAVGGDPYLDVLGGNAWMEAGHFEEAGEAIEKAIEDEPDLRKAYWSRITLSLREKKHPDTLKWLRAIVEKCHVEIRDLAEVPEYADFVKSPQHGEWQKWYAGRGKGNGKADKKEPPGAAEDD